MDYTELIAYRCDRAGGFIFQFFILVPSLITLENVKMGAELRQHNPKPDQSWACMDCH